VVYNLSELHQTSYLGFEVAAEGQCKMLLAFKAKEHGMHFTT